MHQALDTLSDSTSSTTANDLDLIFLKGIMESPVVRATLNSEFWVWKRAQITITSMQHKLVCCKIQYFYFFMHPNTHFDWIEFNVTLHSCLNIQIWLQHHCFVKCHSRHLHIAQPELFSRRYEVITEAFQSGNLILTPIVVLKNLIFCLQSPSWKGILHSTSGWITLSW